MAEPTSRSRRCRPMFGDDDEPRKTLATGRANAIPREHPGRGRGSRRYWSGRLEVARTAMRNPALLVPMLAVSFAAHAAPDCAALKSFSLPTYDIVITNADVVAAA